jgi:hypothetical protein
MQKLGGCTPELTIARIGESTDVAGVASDHEVFKMNLYPIAFPGTDDSYWENHGLSEITGIASKNIYRTLCYLNRFPFICEQVQKHKPKLIIATGIGHLADFFACFAGQKWVGDIKKEVITSESEANATPRNIYWAKINDTTHLFVTPFLGNRNGLNSAELIKKCGNLIREIANR